MRILIVSTLLSFCVGVEKVYLMRHCVRSMFYDTRHRADPAYDSPDNYTTLPFPSLAEWRAPVQAHCTEHGKELAKIFGESLSPLLPEPIHVVADNVSRCIETASSMSAGFGNKRVVQEGTTRYIDPSAFGVCAPRSADELEAGIREQLAIVKDPSSVLHKTWVARHALLAELQELVGPGVAPSIASIEDKVQGGAFVGGMYASSQGMIENFILEAGSNMSVAWGKLDGAKRAELWNKWDPLNILYNNINHGHTAIASHNGAIVWTILQQLRYDANDGSRIMASHDTTIDAVAKLLGLSWSCGPYARNAAQPLMGLLFSRDDVQQHVKIEVVCTGFSGSDAGKAILGSVELGVGGHKISEQPVPIDELLDVLRTNVDFRCVESSPHDDIIV